MAKDANGTALLRPATPPDGAAIEELLDQCGMALDGTAASERGWIVAEESGQLVGVVALDFHGPDALVRTLALSQGARGRGLGTRLMERALTEAALQAVDAVYLHAEDAERFFARFGFLPITRHELPSPVARALGQPSHDEPAATTMRLRLAEP